MNEIHDTASQIPDRCEVCGRQDETVRFVTYPYIFSFVLVTFQRAFSGCWCRFHRIQRWLAASFITSIFGWLGIPFGIVFTPFRLLQLARGGVLDKNINGRILRLIGEEKYHNGDLRGAIRCFEASLLFIDEPEINERLRGLYRSQSSDNESTASSLIGLFVYPAIPVSIALVGIFIGITDFIVRWISSFMASAIPIYIIILLQAPFVILVYFCVVLASYAFQSIVRLTGTNSVPFLSAVGVVTSLLFINGIVSGGTYGLYFVYFINGFRELPKEIWATLMAILTHAGFYIFSPASLNANFSANMLFAILLLLSFAFSLLVLLPKAKALAVQQRLIKQLRSLGDSSGDTFPLFGWIGLIGIVVVFVLFFLATPQKSTVDGLEAFDHVGSAIGYVSSGKYNQAVNEYRLAIELKPKFPLGYLGLGYAYYFSGDFDRARENFEFALSLQPNSVDAISGLGGVYLQEGEFNLAREKFNDALRLDPQNLNSHLGLGWVHLNQFDLENSRKEFEYVKSVAPENAEAYYGLGVLALSISEYERAIDLLNEALRLDPSIFAANIYKGYAYFRQDRYSDAENAFQSVLKVQPDNYSALNGLGDIRASNYEFEEGVEYYDKAIALDPERVDAPLGKASALSQMGEFDKAISVIEPFAEKDGRIRPVISYIYYLKDDVMDGNRTLEESIVFADSLNGMERGQGFFSIASVEFSLADFTKAKRYGELAARDYPIGLDAATYFYMARVYSALGELDSAQTAFENGTRIGHSEVSLHVTKARLLIDQEKLAEAERELQSALQIDARSVNAYTLLSFVHYQQGDLARALVDAKTAAQLNPYDSYAHSRVAFVYESMGRTDEALIEAQEAVRLNTLEDTSHYILGVCYMESGKSEEAIGEFEKFLAHYWDRAYVREYKVKAEEYLEKLKQSP